MAWNKIYLLTKEISSTPEENVSYVRIPKGRFKGRYVAVPKKLVRETKKKTVKAFSFSDDFSFDVLIEGNSNVVRITKDEFCKIFADMHRQGHDKIYGRR